MDKELLEKLVDDFRQEIIKTWNAQTNLAVANRNVEVRFNNYTEVVANYYCIDRSKLFEQNRLADYVTARQVLYWICRTGESAVPISLSKLAEWSSQNHATLIHGIKKISASIEYDKPTRNEVSAIAEILGYKVIKIGANYTTRKIADDE
jgi:chromosomal replication initiation ATPase DnaA